MFENLTGKQGLLFGLISGLGISAIIGFLVFVPTVMKNGAELSNQGANYQPTSLPSQTPTTQEPATATNIPKNDKPTVELFVMSKCPYGLQMEKALIPAYDLLKDKADISIKFVSYAMHGKEEVEENTRQHCAQRQDKDKYFAYLECYATNEDSAGCMQISGLNENKINSCVTKANKDFGIMDKFNDQTTWLNGRYPVYPIDEALNTKYGVQGSPTLVINGVQVESGRTPNTLKATICAAFNKTPSECSQTLAIASPQPGFGAGQTQDTAVGGCGG